jgi:hypothetical protein
VRIEEEKVVILEVLHLSLLRVIQVPKFISRASYQVHFFESKQTAGAFEGILRGSFGMPYRINWATRPPRMAPPFALDAQIQR